MSSRDAALRRRPSVLGEENFVKALMEDSERNETGLTVQHANLMAATSTHDIVFAIGPPGTGKTFTAVKAALLALENNLVKKIIVSRPAVEAGEKLGFLPGDPNDKLAPYLRPIYDAFSEFIGTKETKALIAKEALEIAPIGYMRGRTLSSSFIVLDEAQNCTFEQIHMVLTRLGRGSKMVITGDPGQSDLPDNYSGLPKTLERLSGINGISIIRLTEGDNLRHALVAEVSRAMTGNIKGPEYLATLPALPLLRDTRGASHLSEPALLSHD